MFSLREYHGKQLVSLLRSGDYAHAGEEEAIDLAMRQLEKNTKNKILDVGCGLGGTAFYIQQQGFGHVCGVDVDVQAINYAKQHYPSVRYFVGDALELPKEIENDFNIACLFNVIYAITNHKQALQSIYKHTAKNATLILFDYADLLEEQNTSLYRVADKRSTAFNPIKLATLDSLLKKSGWKVNKTLDISQQYLIWYTDLLNRLRQNKKEICKKYSEEIYNTTELTYNDILAALKIKELGGTLIYANKI